MMQPSISEKRFEIAKMLGFIYDNVNNECFILSEYYLHNYDEDWNLLMKAIIYIENIPHNLVSLDSFCQVYFSRGSEVNNRFWYCSIFTSEDDQIYFENYNSKLECVFEAVYQFSQWYKENKVNETIN